MQLLTLLLGLVAFVSASQAAGVLAIDYGTEWMKVSLLKPGIPFDVLLNTDSKRKIQSIAALKGDDRWIGGDAVNLASRYPDSTYPSVKLLIGKDANHQHANLYETLHRTKIHGNTTSNKIQYRDPRTITEAESTLLNHPEEYLAMQLSHAKKLAKAAAGEPVVDTVVTVPAFFTHAERKAMLDAIELAGLKPLALLDDGSAVAINYAMTRTFPSESPEYHLFYDAGAGSIQATIVALQTKEVKDDPSSKILKNVTALDIKGFGWDLSAGGVHMDGRIRDVLELQYLTGAGRELQEPLAKNKRAQAKLMKEASRVKQVLSANAQAVSKVEGLAEDIDFAGQITRQAFETACEDMKPAFTKPIEDALKAAGLSINDLSSVVLVGGVSRVPMVQDAVTALVGADKVTKNLNADEAAVMGAALYGAALSRQYRTKDIRLTGLNPYAVDVAYPADSAGARIITATLFPANSKLGVQKTMTLRKTEDFDLVFKDKVSLKKLADYHIAGLTSAYANLTDAERQNATVTVSVLLSDSNILTVPGAQLNLLESKESASVADKIKGFFGGKDKEKTEATEGDHAEEDKSENNENAVQAKPKGPIKLFITEVAGDFKPMTEPEKKSARQRLRDLDTAETRKRDREEARNGLEAYTYRLRDQLESPTFVEASTEAERVQIRKKLEEASEWMWDQAETASTKELRAAKAELERAASGPNTRIKEATTRPEAVKDFRMGLVQAQAFLISATEQLKKDTAASEPSKYTEAELKTLEHSIQSAEKWLEELDKKQQALRKNEDSVLKVADLERRRKDISSQISILQLKRPPRKPKKSATASSSSSTGAAASESSGTPVTTPSSSAAPTPTTTVPARDEL